MKEESRYLAAALRRHLRHQEYQGRVDSHLREKETFGHL